MNNKHQPCIVITAFFSIGIIAGQYVSFPLNTAFLMAAVALIAGLAIFEKPKYSTVLLLAALAGSGFLYTQSRQVVDQNDITHVARYYRKKPIILRGVIVSDVQVRDALNGSKTTFTLDVREVKAPWEWEERSGKILVNIFRETGLLYGDRIEIEGKLHRPYNFSTQTNFSYRDYLHNRGINHILSVKGSSQVLTLGRGEGGALKAASLAMRGHCRSILSRHLSKNESGIMKAVLLGDRSGIAKPIRELFVQTGTAHILAISGLHIGVVAGIFLMLAKLLPIGRRAQMAVAILFLISYAFMTGGRPSVVRATTMMSVLLAGLIIEREASVVNTMFLAAMVILAYNPMNLFDVGFQLSFVCVFAIITLNAKAKIRKIFGRQGNKALTDRRPAKPWLQWLTQSFLVSLAVWFAAAGLVAYYFNIVTPITVLANLVVVPLIAVIVTLGLGLLLFGAFFPPCAYLFAACLKIALNAMVASIFLFNKAPLAHILIRDVKIWHVVTYYALLALSIGCIRLCIAHNIKAKIDRIFHCGRIDKRLRV